jgi:SAM-dependent methyltransferase
MSSAAHSRLDHAEYAARYAYLADDIAAHYEQVRYTGALGRYRWRREQRAIASLLALLPAEGVGSVLDFPTGTGRWLGPLNVMAPELILCGDVSPAMLRAARERAGRLPTRTLFVQAAVEEMPFGTDQFDLVFCHALAKHLPVSLQAAVLKDLAHVSRRYVICSLSVRRGIPGLFRQLRRARGAQTVSAAWVRRSAETVGLIIRASRQTSTPLGTERSFVFEKV